MEKALELQKQIRQNADEYRDFVKDLTRWEDKVKNDDKNLQTERRIEEKVEGYYDYFFFFWLYFFSFHTYYNGEI